MANLDSQLDDIDAVLAGLCAAFVRLREEGEAGAGSSIPDLLARAEALVRRLQEIEIGRP